MKVPLLYISFVVLLIFSSFFYYWIIRQPNLRARGFTALIMGGYPGIVFIIISALICLPLGFSSEESLARKDVPRYLRNASITGTIGLVLITINFLYVSDKVLRQYALGSFGVGFYIGLIACIGLYIPTVLLYRYKKYFPKYVKVYPKKDFSMTPEEMKMASKLEYCSNCDIIVSPVKKYSVPTIILLICCLPFFGWGILVVYLLTVKRNKCPSCKQKKFLSPISTPSESPHHPIVETTQLEQNSDMITCPNCGMENNERNNFCTYCKYRLKN